MPCVQCVCSWMCSPLEEAPIGTFACVSAPKWLEIGPTGHRMIRRFLQDLSRAVARLRNDRQHVIDAVIG